MRRGLMNKKKMIIGEMIKVTQRIEVYFERKKKELEWIFNANGFIEHSSNANGSIMKYHFNRITLLNNNEKVKVKENSNAFETMNKLYTLIKIRHIEDNHRQIINAMPLKSLKSYFQSQNSLYAKISQLSFSIPQSNPNYICISYKSSNSPSSTPPLTLIVQPFPKLKLITLLPESLLSLIKQKTSTAALLSYKEPESFSTLLCKLILTYINHYIAHEV